MNYTNQNSDRCQRNFDIFLISFFIKEVVCEKNKPEPKKEHKRTKVKKVVYPLCKKTTKKKKKAAAKQAKPNECSKKKKPKKKKSTECVKAQFDHSKHTEWAPVDIKSTMVYY